MIKHNYVLNVVVDKDYNMFIRKDGKIQHVHKIDERVERLKVQTIGTFMLQDGLELAANDYAPHQTISSVSGNTLPLFTRIFVNSMDITKKVENRNGQFLKFELFEKFESKLHDVELFLDKPQTFFVCGSSNFIKLMLDKINIVQITQTNDVTDCEVVDKFPIELFRSTFRKTNEFKSKRRIEAEKLGIELGNDNKTITENFGTFKLTTKIPKELQSDFDYRMLELTRR